MVFVSAVIDLTNDQMENIWLMAHFQNRLNKRQIKKTNVTNACEDLQQENGRNIQLRTHGQMLLGLSRIHLRQVEYLHADCNDAVSKLKITFNKKSNVDLPPDKDHKSANAITLASNNTGDNNLLDVNDGIFEDLPDPNALDLHNMNLNNPSDGTSDFGVNALGTGNLRLTYGTSSHGLGMIQTSTGQTNNLNSNNNNNNILNNDDNHSVLSFGGNISNIDRNSRTSDLNQFRAKAGDITLPDGSADGSPLRRRSFGTGSNISGGGLGGMGLSYDDTQDVDIEIEFPDGNDEEFDENDAGDIIQEPIDAGTPGSVEAGRGGINNNNNNNRNGEDIAQLANNVSDMHLSGLSAIKGPRPQLDGMSDISDVASAVGSVNNNNNDINNIDNLSQDGNNISRPVMLDESIGMVPDIDIDIPQIDENAADDASIVSTNSVSTADMEAHRAKKRARMRANKAANENATESGNETDDDENGNNNNNNNNNNNRNNKEKSNEAVQSGKRYKRSKKMRFPAMTDDKGKIENDQNIDGNGVDLDSYIVPERDILHIWRQRSIFENIDVNDVMEYPICFADEMFGNNFAANYGNIRNEFDTYMPRNVLECYRDIINGRVVEGAENADDGNNDNNSQNGFVEDMLGPIFALDSPRSRSGIDDDVEFGRDNNNNNMNGMDPMDDKSDDGFGGNNIAPLINDDSFDTNNNGSNIGKDSYMRPNRFDFDNMSDSSDNPHDTTTVIDGNTTVMDLIINDDVGDLNNTVIDEHGALVSILPTPEHEHETRLHSIDEELEDIDVHNVELVEDGNNNNIKKNENEKEKGKKGKKSKEQSEDESSEGKDEVEDNNKNKSNNDNNNNINVKFRSWSKRTQKTLQYLNSKEGNIFSFNDMMNETSKRETVAGVFYELLVLKNANLIEVEQEKCFDDLTVSKTNEFDEYVGKVKIARMSQSQGDY